MSNKRKNVVRAAILGAAIGVAVGPAAASELLSVKPLGTAQSIRTNVLGGKMSSGLKSESTTYAADTSKDGGEGKCGEGKCGEGKKKSASSSSSSSGDKSGEGKCGEGKCGEGKKKH